MRLGLEELKEMSLSRLRLVMSEGSKLLLRLRSLVRKKKEYRTKVIGYSNTISVVTAIIISGILISASVVYLAKRIESAEKVFS